MVAESALVRHPLLILNRGRKRAPTLRTADPSDLRSVHASFCAYRHSEACDSAASAPNSKKRKYRLLPLPKRQLWSGKNPRHSFKCSGHAASFSSRYSSCSPLSKDVFATLYPWASCMNRSLRERLPDSSRENQAQLLCVTCSDCNAWRTNGRYAADAAHASELDGPSTLGVWSRFGLVKQYKNPAPPVAIKFCWLQPWLGCTEFQEAFGPLSRSK